MIDATLTFLRSTARAALSLGSDAVMLRLPGVSSGPGMFDGASLGIVNVGEEHTARQQAHTDRPAHVACYLEPPPQLTVDVLFAFGFKDYGTSLSHLSTLIRTVRAHRHFSADQPGPAGAAAFPAGLDRLVLEMRSLRLEDLSSLWRMIGTPYLPSVVYRARLIERDAGGIALAPRVEKLRVLGEVSDARTPDDNG